MNTLMQEASRGSKPVVSILSPTSGLRVIGPQFYFTKMLGFILTLYCSIVPKIRPKDEFLTKISSLRLLSLQCHSLAFNAEKNSYSRFLKPTKLKDGINHLQTLYFLSPQLENRFKNVKQEIFTDKDRQL